MKYYCKLLQVELYYEVFKYGRLHSSMKKRVGQIMSNVLRPTAYAYGYGSYYLR